MQPSFALLTLGSNDVWQPEKFEANYRLILDALIDQGVVPILATKADNVEGDHAINQTIARLAVEYDLPVWNFWLAVKDLPDGGLQEDGVHLTWASNRFDDPLVMQNAWPVRNLTALQVLDAVWRGVRE
jgi:lysophospholipase L1-like esterase